MAKAKINYVNSSRKRVSAHICISTNRQELIIEHQRRQAQQWRVSRTIVLVSEYIESHSSPAKERFPELLKSSLPSSKDEHPCDVILFHSYAGLFQNSLEDWPILTLMRAGIPLSSMTPAGSDDLHPEVSRQLIALYGEYKSRYTRQRVSPPRRALQKAKSGSPTGVQK